MKKAYEYLLLKRNGNRDGLIYDRLFFEKSKEARKQFKKDDILLKCRAESIFYDDNLKGWTVINKDIVSVYEK